VKRVSIGFRAVFHARKRYWPSGREPKSQRDQQTEERPKPGERRDSVDACSSPADCAGGVYSFGVMDSAFRCTPKNRVTDATLRARTGRGEGSSPTKGRLEPGSAGWILNVNPTSQLPRPPQHIDITN
jgi:hypothetical protein